MGQRKQFSVKCLILVLGAALFITACDYGSLDRTVVPQEITLKIRVLDPILFDSTKSSAERHKELLASFPKVYPLYFTEILLLGDVNSPSAPEMIDLFTQDEQWSFAEERIQAIFADMTQLEKDLSKAMGRYKSMFPEQNIPEVYRLNTGFNYGMYPEGDILAFGAEFYLGAEDPMVKRLPNEVFPAYARMDMKPEQLLPNMMKSLLLVREQQKSNEKDLLNLMCFYGKIMYVLHLTIPEVPENLHFAYSEGEMKWCEENEKVIWSVLVKEEMLFESDRKLLSTWTVRAPFTLGFAEESPGELGWFMGKRMVMDYMKQHQEVSPKSLLDIDAQEILKSYRPG